MFVSVFFFAVKIDVFQKYESTKKKIIQFSVYIQATAALCIISLITDAIATLLTGLGLRTKNHNVKYRFYRYAVLVMLLACK